MAAIVGWPRSQFAEHPGSRRHMECPPARRATKHLFSPAVLSLPEQVLAPGAGQPLAHITAS